MRLSIALIACLFLFLTMPILGLGTLNTGNQSGQDEEIRQLLSVVRDPSFVSQDPDTLVKAMTRLGDLKATEAIDDLIKLLTFKHTYEWEKLAGGRLEAHPVTIFERYPAVVTLYAIGKPALPALIKVIETYDSNSLETQNAMLAVELIFGEDQSRGVKYLEEAAAKAQTIQAAERLSVAARRKRILPRGN